MKRKIILMLGLLFFTLSIISPVNAKDFIYAPVNKALHIIDCDTDTVVKKVPYNDYIFGAVFSADKTKYYLNAYQHIYAVDTNTNTISDIYKPNSAAIIGFNVSSNGEKLYLIYGPLKTKSKLLSPPKLTVYDTKNKKTVKQLTIPHNITSVISSEKQDTVIIGGLDFYELNLKTGKIKKFFAMFNPPKGELKKNNLIIWNNSPAGYGLFSTPYYTVTGMSYLLVNTHDLSTNTLKGKNTFYVYSTLVSPDQKYIYSIADKLIKVDLKTGRTLNSAKLEKQNGYSVCTTSDGEKIYTGPADNQISVYSADSFKKITTINLDGKGAVAHRVTF